MRTHISSRLCVLAACASRRRFRTGCGRRVRLFLGTFMMVAASSLYGGLNLVWSDEFSLPNGSRWGQTVEKSIGFHSSFFNGRRFYGLTPLMADLAGSP